MDGRTPVIIDTSTLINFLAVDRLDLLGAHPHCRFIVTEHARAEVTAHYPHELARLQAALDKGTLEESPVTDIAELTHFAKLSASKQLGPGECASIAAATRPGHGLAIDDKLASKRASAQIPDLVVHTTQSIMVELLKAGLLSVADADAIKAVWAANYRFMLKFTSFQELL